jgi:hypothetical protein
MDQLLVQVDEGGSRPCGVEGESLVEVWRGGKVLVACGARPFAKRARPFARRAHPFGGGRALVACLVGRGLKPLGGLVISSFSLMQLRVGDQIRSR